MAFVHHVDIPSLLLSVTPDPRILTGILLSESNIEIPPSIYKFDNLFSLGVMHTSE